VGGRGGKLRKKGKGSGKKIPRDSKEVPTQCVGGITNSRRIEGTKIRRNAKDRKGKKKGGGLGGRFNVNIGAGGGWVGGMWGTEIQSKKTKNILKGKLGGKRKGTEGKGSMDLPWKYPRRIRDRKKWKEKRGIGGVQNARTDRRVPPPLKNNRIKFEEKKNKRIEKGQGEKNPKGILAVGIKKIHAVNKKTEDSPAPRVNRGTRATGKGGSRGKRKTFLGQGLHFAGYEDQRGLTRGKEENLGKEKKKIAGKGGKRCSYQRTETGKVTKKRAQDNPKPLNGGKTTDRGGPCSKHKFR